MHNSMLAPKNIESKDFRSTCARNRVVLSLFFHTIPQLTNY